MIEETAVSEEEMIEIDAAVTTDWLESEVETPTTDLSRAEIVLEVTDDWLTRVEDRPATEDVSALNELAVVVD